MTQPTSAAPRRRPHTRTVTAAVAAASAALAAAAVGIGVGTADAATIDPASWYQLVNRHSGKVLDIAGGSTADGAGLVQSTAAAGPAASQQFRFLPAGDGRYKVAARHSGKVLDVSGRSTADGAEVVQWTDVNGSNQQWSVLDTDGGHVKLINRNSGKALDLWDFATTDGARISQYADTGGGNQQWRLVDVGTGGPAPTPGTTTSPTPNASPSATVPPTPTAPPTPSVPPTPTARPTPSVPPRPAAYPNPNRVTGDTGVHDPTVVKTRTGGYLLAATGAGIALKTSTDRVAWRNAGSAFPNGASWTTGYTGGSRDLWAPDLSFHNGRYYLYYSASTFGSRNSGIFLATSTTGASGSWTNQGLIVSTTASSNYNAIDPNLIVDEQGRWWLSFGSFWSGIKMIPLDPATGKRQGTSLLSIANYTRGIEAPYVVRRGGFYYQFVSFDLCCRGAQSTYRIMVGRSTSVTGPYVDRNGVAMTAGGGTAVLAGHGSFHGTGHQAVLADTDGDLLVYHYYADNNASRLGINRMAWDAAGWPYVH